MQLVYVVSRFVARASLVYIVSMQAFAAGDDPIAVAAIVADISSKLNNPTTADATRKGILQTMVPKLPLGVLTEMQTNINNNISAQGNIQKSSGTTVASNKKEKKSDD